MSADAEVCLVCCEDLEVAAIGSCNHRGTCAICSVRLRQLLSDQSCILCKRPLEQVIMTADLTRTFEDFSIWGDVCRAGGKDLIYDEASQSFWEDEKEHQRCSGLRSLACSKCPAAGQTVFTAVNMKELSNHMNARHKLVYCDLCVENRKVFSQEHEIFTRNELRKHEVDGDLDGGAFKGHPLCEFCNKRMYDDNALWAHLRRQHFSCHICEAQRQVSNEFYANYNDLENHFRHDHFLCEEDDCLQQKFVVFGNEVELKAHCSSVHMSSAPRSRRAVAVPVHITYRRRDDEEYRTGYGRGRGAGRGAALGGAGRGFGRGGGGGEERSAPAAAAPAAAALPRSNSTERQRLREDEGERPKPAAQRQESQEQWPAPAPAPAPVNMGASAGGMARAVRGATWQSSERVNIGDASEFPGLPGGAPKKSAAAKKKKPGNAGSGNMMDKMMENAMIASQQAQWREHYERQHERQLAIEERAASRRQPAPQPQQQQASGGWAQANGASSGRAEPAQSNGDAPAARQAAPAKKKRAIESIDAKDPKQVMAAVRSSIADEDTFEAFRNDSAAFRRGENDCADYYATHAHVFNLLEDEGLMEPMVTLLPDKQKQQDLRELHEAYACAAELAAPAAAPSQPAKNAKQGKNKGKLNVANEREEAAERMRATIQQTLQTGGNWGGRSEQAPPVSGWSRLEQELAGTTSGSGSEAGGDDEARGKGKKNKKKGGGGFGFEEDEKPNVVMVSRQELYSGVPAGASGGGSEWHKGQSGKSAEDVQGAVEAFALKLALGGKKKK